MTSSDYITTCRGKTAFPSYRDAMRGVKRIQRGKSRSLSPGKIDAYRCDFCHCFHIGHKARCAKLLITPDEKEISIDDSEN